MEQCGCNPYVLLTNFDFFFLISLSHYITHILFLPFLSLYCLPTQCVCVLFQKKEKTFSPSDRMISQLKIMLFYLCFFLLPIIAFDNKRRSNQLN